MASPLTNTLTVWHALFLRECLDRFFANRVGWAWYVAEPGIHLGMIGLLWGLLRRKALIGADPVMWVVIGMMAFFLFRRTAVQTLHAVDCNKAFFAFRQVRPFDAAIARGGVEAFAMFLISILVLACCAVLGKKAFPDDPLRILLVLSGLWVIGLGYGLVTSVFMRLVPDSGHIFQLFMLPLYFISGAMMPLANMVPHKYHDLLLINPLLHATELVRYSFFERYHGFPVSMFYFWMWAIGLFAAGFVLHKLFESRLLTK